MNKNFHFETRAIRIQTERSRQKEHSTPIYVTSSFVFDDAEDMRASFSEEKNGNIYSRFTNPTVQELEVKIASLEGGQEGLATASGMAAIFTCFASFLSHGDHVLISSAVFGSTLKIAEDFLRKWGIDFDYLLPSEIGLWDSKIKPTTKMVYLETPANPTLEIIDLEEVASIFRPKGILIVVDNCFATPYLQRPMEWGADIVIHSATKYIDGQGRVLGGLIVCNRELKSHMMPFLRNAGPSMSPFNAWVLSKSIETLGVRMDRHCKNALELSQFLEKHPKIEQVMYPFLPSFPGFSTAKKLMSQGGGMLAFRLGGGLKAGISFIDRIRWLSISANLGDTRTIVTHPASSTHSKLNSRQREEAGITDGLIRISAGLEHINDLMDEISHALKDK
ncbi:MAG TPA: aminotransferase class V-fold PLP-dependent enzyme [Saprospiraceae bacterium]|nr:aminotransferase class V-fold PLP-dependent enzyme [Saprospiraceae bacterium]